MRSREQRRVYFFATLTTALALALRLYWVFRVQSPFDAVYSDMGGYVDRAKALLSGVTSTFPRLDALYPYGTHYFFAAEFWLFGYEAKTVICILHAFWCALPTFYFVLFASRFFSRAWVPGLLGVVFAAWQPLLWCTGFFLSEVPYIAFFFWNAWLCLRFVERRRGGLALGISGAILFAIRPQFILTFALLAVLHLWTARRRMLARSALTRYALTLAPWVFVVGFGMARFYLLTGHVGLISENGQLNRLFADTTIGRIESRWRSTSGADWMFWVSPPVKAKVHETQLVHLAGYLGDVNALAPVRREYLRDKSMSWRVRRAFRNVTLLWDKNEPWPESDRAVRGLRLSLHRGFNQAVRYVVLPLAVIGAILVKKRAPAIIVLAHLATLIVLSMFFFPEARYRAPYDPFLVLLAMVALHRLWALARRRLTSPISHRRLACFDRTKQA